MIRSYILDFYAQRDYVKRLVHASDETCIEQVRMNRFTFFKLCEMLQTLGGLKSSRHMLVDEQVAMFLHIISHHLKNRVIKHHFNRSGETVSRSFHSVLNAVIRLQDVLFKKPQPITADSSDTRWKWFKNCLGALDGTHIKIRVPAVDKPRYRTRKGDIATNMLGCYYLVDAGYTNCEGFLAPFRGQRYHLNDWCQGYQPSTPQEFFNMKHASARNVIERCFGLLKMRWGILRSPSFYPVRVHNRIIIACCLLHNFIRTHMSIDPIEAEVGEGLPSNVVPEEDAALVSCMVDLHNVGTFNADTGFKASYLNELEKMLEKALPNAMLKARPNIESRVRLLKRDWSIVYDMLNGQNNSGFGWDDHRQVIVAEDAVWHSYLKFRHRSFPYYDQLTAIYAKDRATRKDAQTAADVLEEINAEDVPAADINEERNEYYDCDANVSLDDMDVSATEPQPDRNQGVNDAATLLAENMRAIGEQISRSIASDVVVHQGIQEKAANLYPTLCEIEGLTVDERFQALSKIPDHPTQMVVFVIFGMIKMQAVLAQMDLEEALLGDVMKEKTAAGLWKRLEQICMSKILTSKLHMKQRLYAHRLEEGAYVHKHLIVLEEILSNVEAIEVQYNKEDLGYSILYSRESLIVDEVYDSLTSYDKMKHLVVKTDSQREGLIVRGRQDRNADDDDGRTHEWNPRGKFNGRSKSSNRGKTCNFCKKKRHIKSKCYKLQNKIKREAANQNRKQPKNFTKADIVEDYGDGELLVASINNSKVSKEWILDSGYTFHISLNRDWFTTYEIVFEGVILIGNNASCKIACVGTIKVKMFDGVVRTLSGVRHVPKLKRNLISLSTIDSKGYKYRTESGVLKIFKGSLVVIKRQRKTVKFPAYAHIDNGKLEPRSIKCVFLNYKASVKGYKLWSLENRKLVISRDVVFDETTMLPNLSLKVSSGKKNQKQVEHQINPESTAKSTHQASTKIQNRVVFSPQYSIAKNRTRREIKPPKRYPEADLITYTLNVAEDIDANQEPSNYSDAVSCEDLEKVDVYYARGDGITPQK
ncbi:hypothetical protein GOBAR_DD32770 [Gossypium barbadense]|nr:hypothetical protein GOBAR_DD32770 [Gossypium barbadense]